MVPARLRALVRPEEALLALAAAGLLALCAATSTWRFTSLYHPRFLQVVAVLAACVAARALVRSRRAGVAWPAALAACARETLAVARDFAPFFGILLLYETLHDLTPLLRPRTVDGTLAAADRALFGVDVSFWIGRFASPALTHVMVWCYASYFVAPALLAALIYFRGDRPLFRATLLAGTIAALAGYLGYLAVPAVGPYVFQADLFPTRLPGGGAETHLFIRAIDDARGVARDCFPSLHTAHTTVVLWFAWRFRRWAFLAYLPVALGLYVSTLYLRMHYAVDLAAGFAVAFAACWAAPRLDAWWSRA
jgi:membrane-associated phospholipid phosphatase